MTETTIAEVLKHLLRVSRFADELTIRKYEDVIDKWYSTLEKALNSPEETAPDTPEETTPDTPENTNS